MRIILVLFILWMYIHPSAAQNNNLVLWYDKPATIWEAALPLGNGKIGMMPNGNPSQETIVLNEISMWSGSPEDPNKPNAYQNLKPIQDLLIEGKNDLAEKLVNTTFVTSGKGSGHGNGANVPYGAYQLFANLHLNFEGLGDISNYKRSLDLETATAYTTFTAGAVDYIRKYYTSFDSNVGVISLHSSNKSKMKFSIALHRSENVTTCELQEDRLLIQGDLPDGKGGRNLAYAGEVRIVGDEVSLTPQGDELYVEARGEVMLLFAASTNYYDSEPILVVSNILDSVSKSNEKDLYKEHVRKYTDKFGRVQIQLEETEVSAMATDQRIAAFYENTGNDPAMASLYFQYGRYLMISSTDPSHRKALPPNLQGLWAHQIQTPWNGDYHLNINAQMNHWGVEVSNLSEYHLPFIEMIKVLADKGRATAQAYYNAPGWVTYMMTNIWGYTAPGEQASWGASTASGWLCNHLWEHYLFTQDKEYLSEIYPVLKEAAVFYDATLIKDPKTGWLVTAPSVSPENAFRLPNGNVASVVMGPTIDNQIVRDLYQSVILADSILGLKDDFAVKIKEAIKQLPPAARISKSGRIMEWLEDYEEVEPQHRHVSHLYGLYPAAFISPQITPEWAEAAKETLRVRGDEGTGWSRAWKILFWARLQDGDHALNIFRQLMKPAFSDAENYKGVGAGTYPNLFCAHPPFQIDGNFGGAAGIAEMLIQSHNGYIHLLPALPKQWSNGKISGLKARGNYEVDIEWKDNKVVDYKVRGEKGTVKVLVNGKTADVKL